MSDETPARGDQSSVDSAEPVIRFGKVALDTPDPQGLAAFYAQLLGWKVDPSSSQDWVTIRGEGSGALSFQLAPDHVPPTWPGGSVPQQFHLDLYVAEHDGPQARVLALGATLLDDSADHPSWRVYADPAGHPFCLCLDG